MAWPQNSLFNALATNAYHSASKEVHLSLLRDLQALNVLKGPRCLVNVAWGSKSMGFNVLRDPNASPLRHFDALATLVEYITSILGSPPVVLNTNRPHTLWEGQCVSVNGCADEEAMRQRIASKCSDDTVVCSFARVFPRLFRVTVSSTFPFQSIMEEGGQNFET